MPDWLAAVMPLTVLVVVVLGIFWAVRDEDHEWDAVREHRKFVRALRDVTRG